MAETPQQQQDVTVLLQSMLTQMQQKFEQMSDTMLTKIDEMAARVDDLEATLAGLAQRAGVDIPNEVDEKKNDDDMDH